MKHTIKVAISPAGGSVNNWSATAQDFNHAAKIWNGLTIGPNHYASVTIDGTMFYGEKDGELHRVTAETLEKAASHFMD